MTATSRTKHVLLLASLTAVASAAQASSWWGFEGTAQKDNFFLDGAFRPPDTMGAVGTTQFMETSNGSVAILRQEQRQPAGAREDASSVLAAHGPVRLGGRPARPVRPLHQPLDRQRLLRRHQRGLHRHQRHRRRHWGPGRATKITTAAGQRGRLPDAVGDEERRADRRQQLCARLHRHDGVQHSEVRPVRRRADGGQYVHLHHGGGGCRPRLRDPRA
jgi:hypothetical protein